MNGILLERGLEGRKICAYQILLTISSKCRSTELLDHLLGDARELAFTHLRRSFADDHHSSFTDALEWKEK